MTPEFRLKATLVIIALGILLWFECPPTSQRPSLTEDRKGDLPITFLEESTQ